MLQNKVQSFSKVVIILMVWLYVVFVDISNDQTNMTINNTYKLYQNISILPLQYLELNLQASVMTDTVWLEILTWKLI